MDLQLHDKSVLVMAASRGLGKAVAREFAREGARVTLFARNADSLRLAADDIERTTGQRPLPVAGDLTRPDDLQRAVDKACEAHGPLYSIFNNSGGPPAGGFHDFSDQHWQEAFELTLLAFIRIIRIAHPVLLAHGGGRIVNNASSSLRQAIDPLLLSNVFRTGVLGLTKSLARQFGGDGILVNAVGAGKFDTERVRSLDQSAAQSSGLDPEQLRNKAEQQIPLGRYGDPAELARVAVFLASPANSYLSGQALLIDGAATTAY